MYPNAPTLFAFTIILAIAAISTAGFTAVWGIFAATLIVTTVPFFTFVPAFGSCEATAPPATFLARTSFGCSGEPYTLDCIVCHCLSHS